MDLIGELLRRGLLTEIGGEEGRLGMVREASLALSKRFTGELRPMVPHALVAAVAETTGADSSSLQEAHAELVAKWETAPNAFHGPPISLLRAMVLSAIATAAESDDRVLGAGWYSLRTALEELPVGTWADPLSDLVTSWDDAVWERLADSWAPSAVSSKVTMPSVPKFDNERISVTSAARDEASKFVASGNLQNFTTALMTGYESHVESLIGASEVAAAEAHRLSLEEFRAFANDLGKKLRQVLAAQEKATESIRLRGELLWWQQTAFSPSRRVAYSQLKPSEVPAIAAFDLHMLMPEVAPLAAEHLLAKLVAGASGDARVSIDNLAEVSAGLPVGTDHDPALVLDAVQSDALTPILSRDQKLDAGRTAILLFRDFQARRLSGTATDQS